MSQVLMIVYADARDAMRAALRDGDADAVKRAREGMDAAMKLASRNDATLNRWRLIGMIGITTGIGLVTQWIARLT